MPIGLSVRRQQGISLPGRAFSEDSPVIPKTVPGRQSAEKGTTDHRLRSSSQQLEPATHTCAQLVHLHGVCCAVQWRENHCHDGPTILLILRVILMIAWFGCAFGAALYKPLGRQRIGLIWDLKTPLTVMSHRLTKVSSANAARQEVGSATISHILPILASW